MITYLKDGWYSTRGKGSERNSRMRNEVVDGAIDAAGMLFRAGVPPQVLSRVAFKVRGLVTLVDPFMRSKDALNERQRQVIAGRIEPLTAEYPELHGFVVDCLEHVSNAADLRAFYLHLFHVSQMVQLLAAARGPALAMKGGVAEKKKVVRKKVVKKKVSKKKISKKKRART
jgi:hypothetical protein